MLWLRALANPHFIHMHAYNEMIEKFGSMGFKGDHVVSTVQSMQEIEHPKDFNSLLD